MSEPGLSFEEALAELEAIVSSLETGSLPLHESLGRFQRAIALSRHCAAQLEAAEKQITLLTAEAGLQPATGLPWAEELREEEVEE